MQVLTGRTPFGRQTEPGAVIKVLGGMGPSKPINALDLGLSDKIWKLLKGCWETGHEDRPPVKDVLVCLKEAASTCGILSPVGYVIQRYKQYEVLDSGFNEFGTSLFWSSGDASFMIFCR